MGASKVVRHLGRGILRLAPKADKGEWMVYPGMEIQRSIPRLAMILAEAGLTRLPTRRMQARGMRVWHIPSFVGPLTTLWDIHIESESLVSGPHVDIGKFHSIQNLGAGRPRLSPPGRTADLNILGPGALDVPGQPGRLEGFTSQVGCYNLKRPSAPSSCSPFCEVSASRVSSLGRKECSHE